MNRPIDGRPGLPASASTEGSPARRRSPAVALTMALLPAAAPAAPIAVTSPDDVDVSATGACRPRPAIVSMRPRALRGRCAAAGAVVGADDTIPFAAPRLGGGATPRTVVLACVAGHYAIPGSGPGAINDAFAQAATNATALAAGFDAESAMPVCLGAGDGAACEQGMQAPLRFTVPLPPARVPTWLAAVGPGTVWVFGSASREDGARVFVLESARRSLVVH